MGVISSAQIVGQDLRGVRWNERKHFFTMGFDGFYER
jgi:hypothetical protein